MSIAETYATAGEDVAAIMADMGARARAASRQLALAGTATKNRALTGAAAALRREATKILAANALDVAEMRGTGSTSAFIDRLTLTPELETEVQGLYACGDGAGITRGLVQASASGLLAARAIQVG